MIISDKKGFSLMELIIVIAIMGVMLTIISPMFLTYLGKAQTVACRESRDSLKRDMYNEMILFYKEAGEITDKKFNSFVDEYLEDNNSVTKVENEGYKGICSTNGIVYFSCDNKLNVYAKCSVHGGDEFSAETVDQSNNTAQKLEFEPTYKGAGGSGTKTVMASAIASVTKANVINREMGVSGNSHVAISSQFIKQSDFGTNFAKNVLSQDDELIKFYNDVVEAAPNWSEGKKNSLFKSLTTSSNLQYVSVCTSHTLEDISEMYKTGSTKGETVTIRQYAYLQVELPEELSGEKGRQDLILYGYRDVEVNLHSNLESKYKDTVNNLMQGNYDSNSDTANPLDVRYSNNPDIGNTTASEWVKSPLPEVTIK